MTDTQVAHYAHAPSKIEIQVDYILIDGSGSMTDKWYESLDAIDAYVDGVKNQNIQSQIIVHTFDDLDIDLVQRDQPIEQWIPFKQQPIGANWGMTPLYDAVNVMGRRLAVMDPPRCSILIVTDGGENGSRICNLVQAKAILDWCRAKGWQVTFIGADFSNARQAALLGGNPQSAIGVTKQNLRASTEALAKKRARYGLYGEDMHWTDDEKQQFGGYLNGPAKE